MTRGYPWRSFLAVSRLSRIALDWLGIDSSFVTAGAAYAACLLGGAVGPVGHLAPPAFGLRDRGRGV